MRTSKFLAACALGTSLIAGGAVFTPAFAQTAATDKATQTTETKQARSGHKHGHHHRMKHNYAEQMKNVDTTDWLGIKDVYDKVEAAGYKDIHSIKRTPKGYFASAMTEDGKWAMLSVEPVKGEVKQLERKKRNKDKAKDQATDKSKG